MKKTSIKKIKDVILGLLLIFAAILLILRSTDIALPLLNGISMVKLAGALVVLTFILFRLIDRKFTLILQALTIFYGIFIEEIAHLAGIKESALPSFWIVFLCSIIIEIGFKLIFKKKKFDFDKMGVSVFIDDDDNKNDNSEKKTDSSGISYNGHKVGEVSRYIDCRNFKCEEFGKLVGQVNVYFDNIDEYNGGGELNFNKMVGEARVFVPADWEVKGKGTSFIGDIAVDNSESRGGKSLLITCDKMVGHIKVIRR